MWNYLNKCLFSRVICYEYVYYFNIILIYTSSLDSDTILTEAACLVSSALFFSNLRGWEHFEAILSKTKDLLS